MLAQLFFLAEVLVASFVLWLGLYIITRDLPWRHESEPLWQRPPLIAGAGLILGSVYLYGGVMNTVSSQPEEFLRWQQVTGWSLPLAIACFFWAVVILTCSGRKSPRWTVPVLPVTAGIALLLAIGIVSGYILDPSNVAPSSTLYQPYVAQYREPYNYLFYGFNILGALCSVIVLVHRLPKAANDSARRQKIILGIAGGLALLIGSIVAFYLSQLGSVYLPKQIGDYIAAFGAVLVGYDIAKHNALKHEQIIESDYLHSLISVTTTVLLSLLAYLLLSTIFSYSVQGLAIAMISVLIVITHTPYNWGGVVMDRLFLPRWIVGYREKLLLMRQQPLTMVDPSDSLSVAEETFVAVLQSTRTQELEDLIRREIDTIFKYTNFNNAELLADSKLLDLQIAQTALAEYSFDAGLDVCDLTEHQRADCLRGMLRAAIVDWRWTPNSSSRRARIERNILTKKYVERRSRVDVERHLTDQFDVVITGGGYSRRLKDAREHLARVLHEHELAATTQI